MSSQPNDEEANSNAVLTLVDLARKLEKDGNTSAALAACRHAKSLSPAGGDSEQDLAQMLRKLETAQQEKAGAHPGTLSTPAAPTLSTIRPSPRSLVARRSNDLQTPKAAAPGQESLPDQTAKPGAKSMKRRLIPLGIVLLLLVLAGEGYWYFSKNPQAIDQVLVELGLVPAKTGETGIVAAGFIEAHQVEVVSEVSCRIVQISADEGDFVRKDAELVRLDDALFRAELVQAQAELHVAEAALSQVMAGARAEEIRKAEALVEQFEAAERAAYSAWQDAIVLRENPQDLDIQIDLAGTQLEEIQYRVAGAGADKDAAQLPMDEYGRLTHTLTDGVDYSAVLPTGETVSGHMSFRSGDINQASNQWNQATNSWWKSWINLDSMSLEKDRAEQYLDDLIAIRENPQALDAQVDRAASDCRVAQVQTQAARAQLDWIKAGATPEEIRVAQSQVDQARAQVEKFLVQFDKLALRAPLDGLVVERMAHAGEMAVPNAALLTIANLDEVSLTLYIPEYEIGRVTVGQPVEVIVDSFPDRTFAGQVSFVAPEAEFTPKNVQTVEERVNMVFAVKIDMPNPDFDLKAGMPADAIVLLDHSERQLERVTRR